MLARVKMVAEPWDIGEGGYQLGGYPRGWSEWNDKFRDAARGFWKGDSGTLAKVTQGLTGSREVFAPVPALAARQRQLHRQPRRLHAGRHGVVRGEAQRGQRRGQPRRP